MLRRFFNLIARSLLTLVGIAIVIEAIRFNSSGRISRRDGWDPISEFLLCVGVVVGGYGAYLAYSGWDPEAAAKFVEENNRISPSPGTPGEGWGEGSVSIAARNSQIENPEPSPQPFRPAISAALRAPGEGARKIPPPSDMGVQP